MIRSITPGDLWVLRRKLRHQVVLYNEALLAQAHQPFIFALRCFLEGTGRDLNMLSFHDRGVRAFVQARGRHGRPEQDILFLASQRFGKRTMPSDYDIWFRLLEHISINAGHNHIQRLYSAIWSHQVELYEIFRQLGFQSYLKRVVLQLSGPDWDQGTTLAMMRPQARHDAWAIHKLYGAVAPHLVQRAEVRTPRSWILPLTQRWRRSRRRGWVTGIDDDLTSYLYALSGPSAHVFALLQHPDARENTADVLRFGLAQVNDDKPVYLLLAEYQSELFFSAQNLGFQPVGEQTLLIKNMTVPVRKPVLLTAFETGLEPQITIPHNVSMPREDAPYYARATRNNQ